MISIYILLLTFIAGVIFVALILPVVDGLVGLILQQFEVWKSAMALKLTENSVQTHELQKKIDNPTTGQQTQVIGFAIDTDEEEEEDDEDI